MTNDTGSTGYGEECAEAIHKYLLRGPAAEIERAADEAIRMFPFIDATRQAAAAFPACRSSSRTRTTRS